MGTIKSYTLKLYGTVAYSDNSKGMFEVTTDDTITRGQLAVPKDTVTPLTDFAILNRDQHTALLSLFTDTTWVVTLTTSAQSTSKTVKDFVAFLTGSVAYTDNTKASFAVEWFKGGLTDFKLADTTSVGTDLRAQKLATLNAWLQAVAPLSTVA